MHPKLRPLADLTRLILRALRLLWHRLIRSRG